MRHVKRSQALTHIRCKEFFVVYIVKQRYNTVQTWPQGTFRNGACPHKGETGPLDTMRIHGERTKNYNEKLTRQPVGRNRYRIGRPAAKVKRRIKRSDTRGFTPDPHALNCTE